MPLIQTPSIASIVEDQTPQLGGSLSTNGSNINVESGDVLYVHNLGTEGDSNYERLEVKWDTNVATIGPVSAGTGSSRGLTFQVESGQTMLFRAGTGTLIQANASNTYFASLSVGPVYDSFTTSGDTTKRWSNTYTDSITIGNGVDAVLTADAADTLALRNSTTAQAFNVYNTYTDASNYERGELVWDSNILYLRDVNAGTGSDRRIYIEGSFEVRMRTSAGNSWIFGKTVSATYSQSVQPGTGVSCTLGGVNNRWTTTHTKGIATDVETFTAASDTLDAKNNVALCDCTSNAVTLALPVPVAGLQFHIKKIDGTANTVNIEPDDPGPELIDGAIVYTLSTQYNSVTVVSDGSNWFVI